MRIIGGKHRGTKLYTLEGVDTRPTLDRIKEPLFSIINFDLPGAIVLDLFSGSGALGLESISRGAQKAILCDNSKKAIHIIEKNVEKIKSNSEIQILNDDYIKILDLLKNQKFDIIFLDPPYNANYYETAIEKIFKNDLLSKEGIIILETDKKEKLMKILKQKDLFDVYDERKYGRVNLIFLRRKG